MSLQKKVFSYGDLAWQSYSNAYIMELILTEESVSLVNNTSKVSYTLRLRSGTQNRFSLYKIGAKVSLGGKVVANRKRVDSPQYSLDYSSTVNIISGTTNIEHASNGKKTISVEFSIDMETGKYVPGPLASTGSNMVLTYIPRASDIKATDAIVGSFSTITIDAKDSSFKHTIKYEFGNVSGYVNSEGNPSASSIKLSGNSLKFNIPTSFAAHISGKQIECILKCATYSGNTKVGDTQVCTFKLKVSGDKFDPVVSINALDTNTSTKALTGNDQKFIRYMSNVQVNVSYDIYIGAKIKSASVNDKSVEIKASPITSNLVPKTGTIKASVTDSRDNTGSVSKVYTIVPYVKLTNNSTCKRSDPTSGKAIIKIKGTCFKGDFGVKSNSLKVTCTVDDIISDSYTPTIKTDNTYSMTINLDGLDYTKEYKVKVVAEDALMTVSKTLTISKGIPVFDWGSAGFNFNVPISINGVTMMDFVVEQGTTDGWYYRKWSSGKAELFRSDKFSTSFSSPWGNIYQSDNEISSINYPFTFKERPIENVSVGYTTTYAAWIYILQNGGDTSKTSTYKLCRPTSVSNVTDFKINYQIFGKWR